MSENEEVLDEPLVWGDILRIFRSPIFIMIVLFLISAFSLQYYLSVEADKKLLPIATVDEFLESGPSEEMVANRISEVYDVFKLAIKRHASTKDERDHPRRAISALVSYAFSKKYHALVLEHWSPRQDMQRHREYPLSFGVVDILTPGYFELNPRELNLIKGEAYYLGGAVIKNDVVALESFINAALSGSTQALHYLKRLYVSYGCAESVVATHLLGGEMSSARLRRSSKRFDIDSYAAADRINGNNLSQVISGLIEKKKGIENYPFNSKCELDVALKEKLTVSGDQS